METFFEKLFVLLATILNIMSYDVFREVEYG